VFSDFQNSNISFQKVFQKVRLVQNLNFDFDFQNLCIERNKDRLDKNYFTYTAYCPSEASGIPVMKGRNPSHYPSRPPAFKNLKLMGKFPNMGLTLLELNGIDVNNVIRNVYIFSNVSNKSILISEDDEQHEHTKVDIGDTTKINMEKDSELIIFDTKRNIIKYYGNMHDISTNGPLPRLTTIPCWNCRRKFNTQPLGIPIRYVKHSHHSHDRDMWNKYLQENNYCSRDPSKSPETILDLDGYFETEGVVCRWECMKNYIHENSISSKYKDSIGLMYLLHAQLTNGKPFNYRRGGSWKILKEWGGHIEDHEFDNAVSTSTFSETTNVARPLMFSLSQYYRQD
jgi:hypothetical protein